MAYIERRSKGSTKCLEPKVGVIMIMGIDSFTIPIPFHANKFGYLQQRRRDPKPLMPTRA